MYELFSTLSREQKTGVVLLLVFSLLAVGLGALQMRNTIYGPFVIRADKGDDDRALVFDENARLQQIDTDHDGLNDYDELNFYSTSPYLPDTDSDGTPDKTEIDRGTDPTCVEGKPCAGDEEDANRTPQAPVVGLGADSTFSFDPNAPNPIDALTSLSGGGTGSATGTVSPEMLNTPKALRELLLQSGSISAEQLSGISDETLLRLAKEAASGE